HRGSDSFRQRFGLSEGIAANFAVQPATRGNTLAVARQIPTGFFLSALAAQRIKQVTAHAFDGRNPRKAQFRRCRGCIVNGLKSQDSQGFNLGYFHQLDRHFGDNANGAFRTRNRLRRIETVLVQQIVQSVTGYLAGESAKFGINEVSVSIDKLMQLLIDACVAYPTAIESSLLTIGQHESDRYEVFCRGTIRDRVRTAGI